MSQYKKTEKTLIFEKYYNKFENKVDYDKAYNEMNYVDKHSHLSEYLVQLDLNLLYSQFLSTPKWLDIGCGTGVALGQIEDFNFDVYGFDIVDESVDKARQLGLKNIIKHDASKKFPYKNNFFDIVSVSDMLEHLTISDINFALKEIKRVLKPNGVGLFASIPNDDKHHVHITIKSIEWWSKLYTDFNFENVSFLEPYCFIVENKKEN